MVLTRQQSNSKRALWMSALAVVAVSALHVGRFHGAQESWPVELFGHHASIVLAFAILHQDYRFALADLFLRQALAFLVLVALVFGGFSIVEPLLLPVGGRVPPSAIAGARDGGTIALTATLDDDLRIVVRNTGAPLGARTDPGLGVGLDNVRRRLQHYFGEDASVTVTRDAEGATVAELRLPAADAEGSVEVLPRSAVP